MGSIVQSIANLGTAFVIAFIYGWKLTLLIVAFLPFIMIAGALQMKLLQGVAGNYDSAVFLPSQDLVANFGRALLICTFLPKLDMVLLKYK